MTCSRRTVSSKRWWYSAAVPMPKPASCRECGESASFPDRRPPQIAQYSIRKSYGRMLNMFQEAFERENPLFSLAIYYPLAHYIGPDEQISPADENRQQQVVGLIRILFLKRFESSVHAFERSLDRLMRKLLAFVEVHSETSGETIRYERWVAENSDMVAYQPTEQLGLPFDASDEESWEDLDEDIVPQELLEDVEGLPRDDYNVPAILDVTYGDLDRITRFLAGDTTVQASAGRQVEETDPATGNQSDGRSESPGVH